MPQKHQFELRFSSNMADFTVLSLQVEREEILCAIFIRLVNDIVLTGESVRDQELYFFHAAHVLTIFILHVDFLMKDLVREPDDSPPKNLSWHLIELFAQLVENGWAASSVECASVVVGDDDLLLTLELSSVKLVQFCVTFFFSWALLSDWCFDLLRLGWVFLFPIPFRSLGISIESWIEVLAVRVFQVSELLLGLLHLFVLNYGLSGLFGVDLGVSFLEVPLLDGVFICHFLVSFCLLLHVAAVFVVRLVIYILLEELLVDLPVLYSGAFLEASTSVIDDDDLTIRVVNIKVIIWSVVVDQIRENVLWFVEPVGLKVGIASAVQENQTSNCLQQAQKSMTRRVHLHSHTAWASQSPSWGGGWRRQELRRIGSRLASISSVEGVNQFSLKNCGQFNLQSKFVEHTRNPFHSTQICKSYTRTDQTHWRS